MTIVAITGHRPEKIADPDWVKSALTEVLQTLAPEKLIQGMAAGIDLLSAKVAYELHIPFVAARPWAAHAPRYQDKAIYDWAMQKAAEVVNVDPSMNYVGPWIYQKRNEYMVDHGTVVVAVWDGTKGGTGNCVRYAKRKNVPIVIIDPEKKTITYPKTEEPVLQEDPENFLF
jgi:uncharacterized phage-like protein YoqJ